MVWRNLHLAFARSSRERSSIPAMAAEDVGHGDLTHARGSLVAVTIASVAAAVAAAAVGALLALGMVRSGEDAAALRADSARAPRAPAAVGQDVTTSFGVVAVQSITRSAGPTAKALAGVTHGIQNLIAPDKVQIVATVTLTNLRLSPVPYPARRWRRRPRSRPRRRGRRRGPAPVPTGS